MNQRTGPTGGLYVRDKEKWDKQKVQEVENLRANWAVLMEAEGLVCIQAAGLAALVPGLMA